MEVTERAKILSTLPIQSCMAFAAVCSERAVAEANKIRPETVAKYPALRDAVDLLWRHAISLDLDFDKDFKPLLKALSDFLPESTEDLHIDPVPLHAASAVSLGIAILKQPNKAGRLAAGAGNNMSMLVGYVYEDWEKIQDKEEEWQDQAVELLVNYGNQPIKRTMFESIPEYDRGPISEEYLNEENW